MIYFKEVPTMKKLLALILAALMVLTGVAALAEDFEVPRTTPTSRWKRPPLS